jgi:very-short-patch-repair endonuclease
VQVLGRPQVPIDPAQVGYDVVWPVAPGNRRRWIREIAFIFLPGVPRGLREQGRIFLKQGADIFWSAPVQEILSDSDRVSDISGEQHGDGPSVFVDLERGARHRIDARLLPTPDGKPWHDRRGMKYVSAGCHEYVKLGPRPPRGAMRSRSSNEVALERALRKHLPVDTDARRLKLHDGLPRPIVEVDIVVPELRLVIEYDGAYWHRGREDHDRRKTSRLIAAGLNVIRIRDDGLAPLGVGESVSIERQLTSDDVARLVLNLVNPREQRRCSRIFLRRMPRDRTDDLPRAR